MVKIEAFTVEQVISTLHFMICIVTLGCSM